MTDDKDSWSGWPLWRNPEFQKVWMRYEAELSRQVVRGDTPTLTFADYLKNQEAIAK